VQFAENVQANWQEGYCFIMTMPDPIELDFAHSDFRLFGPLKNHLGGKRFADDKEVET
jgi:hypothetical protein